MFYTGSKMRAQIKALPLLLAAAAVFSPGAAADDAGFGTVPMELLRPRRDEPLRYPVDTVIGPLGPGRASRASYEFAGRVAAALLAGNPAAPILSSVDRVFVEDFMAALDAVHPRSFRLGSGEETPDGFVSFLVRFVGRDHGITGELFIRQDERRLPSPPAAAAPPDSGADGEGAAGDAVAGGIGAAGDAGAAGIGAAEDGGGAGGAGAAGIGAAGDGGGAGVAGIGAAGDGGAGVAGIGAVGDAGGAGVGAAAGGAGDSEAALHGGEGAGEEAAAGLEGATEEALAHAPLPPPPVELVWVFDDLVLEAPRSREEENQQSRQQFGLSIYHRLF